MQYILQMNGLRRNEDDTRLISRYQKNVYSPGEAKI